MPLKGGSAREFRCQALPDFNIHNIDCNYIVLFLSVPQCDCGLSRGYRFSL